MTDRIPDDQLAMIAEMFRRGRTYPEIATDMNLPMSQVAAVLCTAGLFRDQIMARRIVMNQMAQAGVYVEEIADTVGLKLDTVKSHLRKSRVQYLLKPKEGKS